MARFNEILVGRYNRFLQKLLAMKGGPPAPQLSSEIAVGIPLFHGVENRYLEGWERFSVSTTVAAAVGNVDGVKLRNPTTSNVAIAVERVQVANTAAAAQAFIITLGASATDFATTGLSTNSRLDSRQRPTPAGIVSIQNTTAAITGLGAGVGLIALLPNTTFDAIVFEGQEVTLLPGDALQIVTSIVNQQIAFATTWRERFLEDSERT